MAQLFNILKITVGADKLCARVLVNPGMPLRTSEDIEATARVYYLVPPIAKHLCLGDTGREFQECMGDTELPHLLEHVTVEIMNETGLAGSVSCGRTRQVPGDERLFDVELSCPDDALTVGALSSATFMMDWAFLHADAPAPDFPGTVKALRRLALSLRGEQDAPGDEGDAEQAETDDTATMAEQPEAVAAGAPQAQGAEPVADEAAYDPRVADAPAHGGHHRGIDTEGIRMRAKMAGKAPAKRVADVFRPVFGGAASSDNTER